MRISHNTAHTHTHTHTPPTRTLTYSLNTIVQVEADPIHLPSLEQAYDEFLGEFPLCFAYWKRYADCVVKVTKDASSGRAVYQKAVAAGPHSVELWLAYVAFMNASFPDEVRGGPTAGCFKFSTPFVRLCCSWVKSVVAIPNVT